MFTKTDRSTTFGRIWSRHGWSVAPPTWHFAWALGVLDLSFELSCFSTFHNLHFHVFVKGSSIHNVSISSSASAVRDILPTARNPTDFAFVGPSRAGCWTNLANFVNLVVNDLLWWIWCLTSVWTSPWVHTPEWQARSVDWRRTARNATPRNMFCAPVNSSRGTPRTQMREAKTSIRN